MLENKSERVLAISSFLLRKIRICECTRSIEETRITCHARTSTRHISRVSIESYTCLQPASQSTLSDLLRVSLLPMPLITISSWFLLLLFFGPHPPTPPPPPTTPFTSHQLPRSLPWYGKCT